MSLRAAVRLTQEGYGCRVLDLRWLAPLPVEDLVRAAELTGKVRSPTRPATRAGCRRGSWPS